MDANTAKDEVEQALYRVMDKAKKYDELLMLYKSGKNELFCSFCGKSQSLIKKLISGPGVLICNECVGLCAEILIEEKLNEVEEEEK